MRQIFKAGLIVLVVAAVATTGVALAQDGDDGIDEVRRDHLIERLGELVERGVITEKQAGEVADHLLEEGLGPRPPGPHRAGPGVASLEEIAEFLRMEVDEIRERLGEGGSLREIAGERADDLTRFLLDAIDSRLSDLVADGRLDADRKAEMMENAAGRVDALLDATPGDRPLGPGFGPHHRGHHGPGFGGPGLPRHPCDPDAKDPEAVDAVSF